MAGSIRPCIPLPRAFVLGTQTVGRLPPPAGGFACRRSLDGMEKLARAPRGHFWSISGATCRSAVLIMLPNRSPDPVGEWGAGRREKEERMLIGRGTVLCPFFSPGSVSDVGSLRRPFPIPGFSRDPFSRRWGASQFPCVLLSCCLGIICRWRSRAGIRVSDHSALILLRPSFLTWGAAN